MVQTIGQFVISHLDILTSKLLQHIYLTTASLTIALLIGVPLGILITRIPKLKTYILGTTSIFQTIPSLAILAFLIPFLGIGAKTAIVALSIYALLPIVRNTYTGLTQLPDDIIEAANGLGFTLRQRLFKVELPLALPVIIAGIRTATAIAIGIATIAAFIGAGGLGDFITQGLALDNTRLILLGAIPAALLALLADGLIAQLERIIIRRQHSTTKFWNKWKIGASILIVISIILLSYFCVIHNSKRKNVIIVGSKNFTEQFILANIMADVLKAKTDLKVETKINLGTIKIAQSAITQGAIDTYPEYTGTAYLVVLKKQQRLTANETYQAVKTAYKKQFDLTWLKPFGFFNSQTIAVPQRFAKRYHLKTLSDLAKLRQKISIAAPAEFIKRPDGLPGLQKTYQLSFSKIIQMQPDLMYSAIASHKVQSIEVFTTDARIKKYHLIALKDDLHFYPPYYAAPVIRIETIEKHPSVEKALLLLAGKIDNATMMQLNYQVEIKGKTPAAVAQAFVSKLLKE